MCSYVSASEPTEARAFVGLVRRGNSTVEAARATIAVSAAEEAELARILDRVRADEIVSYRRRILNLFDRLLAESNRSRVVKRPRLSANGRKCPHLPGNRREVSLSI